MSLPVPTLDSLDFGGKSVLCRVDFNVPMNGAEIDDDARILGALPTIKVLRDGDAKIILCSHLGRPKGVRNPSLSLLPAAARLAELLDTEVVFSHDTVGDGVVDLARELPRGGVMVLENLRFHPEEKGNSKKFAKNLADFGDIFVNDAFGAMHRSHASITGVPQFLPSCVGLLVQRELAALGQLTEEPQRPYGALLGGAKVSEKIGVIDALSKQVDFLFIGGAMAYTFLAAKGEAVGASRVGSESIEVANRLLARCERRNVKVYLPTDHVVAEAFEQNAAPSVVTEIPDGQMGLDIGPQTLATWSEVFARCKTLFWNGPMGVFEWDSFAGGTRGVAEALASSTALTIVGGGDSAAAIAKFGHVDRINHLSTGGGASLAFLQDGDLAGLKAIRKSK
jgi:phosphoglycerate kinase